MSDQISNKTLAILLLCAIIISLAGTIVSLNRLSQLRIPTLTGFAVSTDEGTATVNILSTASIRFAISALNFGTGAVNTSAGNQYCNMASNNSAETPYKDGSDKCINFSDSAAFVSLQIENDGNENLTVNISASTDADGLLGGSSPGFWYSVENNESLSCGYPINTEWTAASTSEVVICNHSHGGLGYLDSRDSMDIHVNISIPYNGLTGVRTATFTATGETYT